MSQGDRGTCAPGKGQGMIVIGLGELKIELEGVILPKIRRKTAVLKSIVENSETAARDQLFANLIGKPEAWREICLLRVTKSFAVLIGNR